MVALADVRIQDRCLDVEVYPDVTPEEGTGPSMTWLPRIWPSTSICFMLSPERKEKEMLEEATSVTRDNYISAEDDQQTSTSARNNPILLLEKSARAGDHYTFAALVEAIDWSTRQPDELTTAIDLALSLEMASLAIELAQLGARLFPDHERVQQAAKVLAPPVVRAVRPSRAKELGASRAWLREHASEYRGQWLAVRQGRLLGAATSLEVLVPLIGEGEDAASTIVTRVL